MTNNLYKFIYALRCTRKILTSNAHQKIFSSACFERDYSSALYISGKIGHKVFAFLTPYLDADERFADVDKLQKELALRGMNVDVGQLKKLWEFYQKMDMDKCALEDNQTKIVSRLKQLFESGEHIPENKQEILKLRTQLKVVREDLKTMKHAIWDLDTDVIERVLKLPNELDPRTPVKDSVVLKSVGSMPQLSEKDRKNHIDIGTELSLLQYKDPIHYYLCNNAALFELALLAHAARVLGDSNNMVRVDGADFSRSLVVEGSGLNHEDPDTAFLIENHDEVERGSSNRMHLIGGASLTSFLMLHTKQLINPTDFPLKYFATGRQYVPLPRNSQPCGLLTVCQASVMHAFVMVKDTKSEEYKVQFEELLESVCQLYDDLCVHYRVVVRSASELQPWEGLRVSFEVWSPFANRYFEVGHISACGNYFSKRLLITYQMPNGRDFPAAISGTVLSVPRLLACLLEQNPNEFVIPPKVAELMPSDDCVSV